MDFGFRAGLRSCFILKVFSSVLIHQYITWRSHCHEIVGLHLSRFSLFGFDSPSPDTATTDKARGPIGVRLLSTKKIIIVSIVVISRFNIIDGAKLEKCPIVEYISNNKINYVV